jgi:two-component system, LytTR family, sensor kinase
VWQRNNLSSCTTSNFEKEIGAMVLGYKSIKQIAIVYSGIGLMVVIAYLVRMVKFQGFSEALNINLAIISLIVVTVFWETLRWIDRYLDRRLPFEAGIPQRVFVQLVLGALTGIAVRFFIYFFGEPYLPFKLDQMFLATTWVIYAFLPTAINLGFFTSHFIDRWKTSLIVAERLEKEKSQVQFDNLKNQLNPHFLFNALTSLNSLIFEDQVLASQFLQQLSKVYRYVLQNKDKTIVTLDVELSFIEHYVSLLHTRFQGFLTIDFKIPEEARSRAIVPVTLQILIENALKHNIVDKAKPLSIQIRVDGDYLEVSNNLQEKKMVETSNQQGLENLRSLYRFLTDKPLNIEKNEGKFIVKVPLI